ncbi:alanine racemase [Antricoccus suffuscus]|nr:alanine racemase [Antricoccus suffuscus]
MTSTLPLITVDLAAITHNVATMRERVGRPLMAVVKANGYGHGMLPVAAAAQRGGADALGVATIEEAVALRDGGTAGRIVCWLHAPRADYAAAIAHDIEVASSAVWALAEIEAAARTGKTPAKVHLKIDTGLARSGATAEEWPDLVARAATAQRDGLIEVVGVWSHFAYADSPGHPTIAAQRGNFVDAVEVAKSAGLSGFERHLANSAATLNDPDSWFDMVRPGVAIYGLDPVGGDSRALGLRPAMRVEVPVALTKRVSAGTSVSYGHTYTTDRETTLALIPVGYADGIPRNASGVGPVGIGGVRHTISGRVCMDQFVVDVGDANVQPGDIATLWGDGRGGTPTAQDWADATDTIHYELVTRIGGRFVTTYVGGVG